VNVYVRKSASHKIGSDCSNEQTRVRPYAGETHSVTCAPSNVCNVPHWKKISASDSEMNCREMQVPNVYSVCVASACPPELRSDRQPNHLATAVVPPHVVVRERPNIVAGNKFAETPRSSGDVQSIFNEVAGINP